MKTYVRCGTLFTGLTDAVEQGRTVVIEDGKIRRIVPTSDIQSASDGTLLDYSDCFVMPGLIDVHTHLAYGNAKTDYAYIWGLDGTGVMHPIKPEWNGQPMLGKVKDGNGVDIVRSLIDGINASSNGTAFVQTNFPRPGTTNPVPKLQYVLKVDGWNWIVGSGLYTDDLDAQLRKELLGNVAYTVVALLVIGVVGLVVAQQGAVQLRQFGAEVFTVNLIGRATTRELGILMVVDEVITGFGRTGPMFACEAEGVVPDLMTMAKGLTSGYAPLGALAIGEKLYRGIKDNAPEGGPVGHGQTYSGHPVSAAVALEVLRLYDEGGILANGQRVGAYFERKLATLADHPLVGEAVSCGLMGAIQLVKDKATRQFFPSSLEVGMVCRGHCFGNGLIMRAVGDRMIIAPPLAMTVAQIDEMAALIRRCLDRKSVV